MKNMKKWLLLMCITAMMSLTGCAKAVTLTNPEQAMNEVVERNVKVLDEFRLQGLISDAQYNNYTVSLRARAEAYTDLIQSAKNATSAEDEDFKATLSMLKNSLVHRLGEEDGNGGYYGRVVAGANCPDGDDFTYFESRDTEVDVNEFSNLIKGSKSARTSMDGRGDEAEPLIFIDENNLDSLLKEINRQVYVLDESKIQTEDDLKNCLEAIYNVKKAESSGSSGDDETYQKLKQIAIRYFKPTDYTVYNFTKEDLVKVSEDNSENLGSTSGGNSINKDLIINGLVSFTKHNHTTSEKGKEECETSEIAKSVGVYSLRVQEFNADLYEMVKEQAATKEKYISLQPASGEDIGVALLMEYPVAVIESLEASSADNAEWHFNLEESNMRINLYSGEMLIRNEDGTSQVINDEEEESERLYRVFPAHVGLDTEDGKNISFAVYSKTDIPVSEITMKIEDDEEVAAGESDAIIEDGLDSDETVITTVMFALKDYLELTYMPEVVADENFVATGRRIIITDFSGKGDEQCGYYADKYGDEIILNEDGNGNGYKIGVKPSEIIDFESGNSSYYEEVAKVLAFSGNKNKEIVEEELEKTEAERVENLKTVLIEADVIKDTAEESAWTTDDALLNYNVYFSKIYPVLSFTSSAEDNRPGLDTIDVGNTDISPASYYGLCVDTHAFQTGLYTQWIDVYNSDGENGCLSWWNEWLYAHGYHYQVDIGKLRGQMKGLYSVSLAEMDDTIVFDTDVLKFIVQDQTEEASEEMVKVIRTIETLIGALLLIYGMIMLSCWLIDVNLVNGPGLLTLVSFGRFVAIRDTSEIPRMPDGKVYVDAKYLLVVMLILMILGIVLIVFDIKVIRDAVYNLFDNFVELFKNLMLNR